MKKKWMKLLAGVMVLALAGCGSERTRVGSGSSEDGKTEAVEAASTVVWGLCSSFEDAFPEEWQDGFNELLRERDLRGAQPAEPVFYELLRDSRGDRRKGFSERKADGGFGLALWCFGKSGGGFKAGE